MYHARYFIIPFDFLDYVPSVLLISSYVHNLCVRYLCDWLFKFKRKCIKTSAEYNLISHVVCIYVEEMASPYTIACVCLVLHSLYYSYDVAFQYI